ncbi:hypothetical protein [Nocardia nova]|uniref:hypothetical protein n=1 Tax=Nocardia nova TaxID=37330 RepID=UPI0033FB5892
MNTKAIIAGAAISIAALTVGSGTAYADSGDGDHNVGYRATTTASSLNIETDSGSLVNHDGVLEVRSDRGKVLAGTELSFRVDDFVFPIRADITGRNATLTPEFDPAHALYRPAALPYEDQAPWKTPYDREQAAWTRLTSTLGAGATIGTLVGGISGGAVGCLLGGIAGATVAAATIAGLFGPFVPAAVVGCLGGIVAVGALGTLAGQLLVTAPVAVLAAVQYFTTVNQPFPAH